LVFVITQLLVLTIVSNHRDLNLGNTGLDLIWFSDFKATNHKVFFEGKNKYFS
jgi:hypothetical protein